MRAEVDGPIVARAGLELVEGDNIAAPRGALVAWMMTANDHLERAVNAVAANDIAGLRREFHSFVLNAKAAADTLEDAVAQMLRERQ